MRDEIKTETVRPDPVQTLRGFAESESDVLRCAAIKALGAFALHHADARAALQSALLDPDPDVRTDAMEAYAPVADETDLDRLLHSLKGDPVREVKVAAIGALARLGGDAAVPLLRSLVLSRTEDQVDWEDQDSDWEDWLDVQIAAIRALGDLRCSGAIGDMLVARDDELAQALDIPVFEALIKLGPEGVATLLAIIETEPGLSPQRAADVLTRSAPEVVHPYLDMLLAHADPALRAKAVSLLPTDSPELSRILTEDQDPKVRAAALAHGATAIPILALKGLRDSAAEVQAAAVNAISLPGDPDFESVFTDNLLAWIDTGKPILAEAAIDRLPEVAGDRAEAPLLRVCQDKDRPLMLRVAAVKSLGRLSRPVKTAVIAGLLELPVQQVRVAALVLLRDRAEAGDADAVRTIAGAIDGSLLPYAIVSRTDTLTPDGPDVGAPKGEGEGPRRIRITADGDIVDTEASEEPDKSSTLQSILDGSASPDLTDDADTTVDTMAEDTPEESAGKRRKRRPVEGTEAFANDLSREAMQICASSAAEPVQIALLSRTTAIPDPLRRTAWQALDTYCSNAAPSAEMLVAAETAFDNDDPVVRLSALRVLGPESPILLRAQSDDDPLIRAHALSTVPVGEVLHHLGDDALAVRRAALGRLLDECAVDHHEAAVSHLISAERSDGLAWLLGRSDHAKEVAAARLSDKNLPRRQALVILTAFGNQPAAAR